MDVDRFDALARALTSAHPRRGVLATTLGGALGLLGLAHPDAGEAKKKPCPPCKKRKKGKCKGRLPDGASCRGGSCRGGSCVAAPLACGVGGPCRVFLSSTTYDGNLGGLSGADAKCQGLAAAAGLPGAYRAWLSDATSSPSSRFVPSGGPYRLVNGTTIAANWTDLTDGTLLAPIDVTETGGGLGATATAWTYTAFTGHAYGDDNHCQNWSTNVGVPNTIPIILGSAGDAPNTDSTWTHVASIPCSFSYHLYCFQQG